MQVKTKLSYTTVDKTDEYNCSYVHQTMIKYDQKKLASIITFKVPFCYTTCKYIHACKELHAARASIRSKSDYENSKLHLHRY